MRRFFKSAIIAFICGVLVIPSIEAQGRRDNNRRPARTENTTHASKQPKQNHNKRPRSDNKHNDRCDKHMRKHNDNNRHLHMPPPKHNHRPVHRAYHRPVPPPAFRPHHNCPVVHNILGLTFGTTINLSLDYLYRNGYMVNGYGNNVVYLRNVNQLAMVWPDVMLYYGSGGLLGSRFCHSTSYYNRTRYNQIYSTFVSQYGSPVSYENTNNRIQATWFGNNGYISLEYSSGYANDGSLRYFTTLSIGC